MLSLTTKRCQDKIRPSYRLSGRSVLATAMRYMVSEAEKDGFDISGSSIKSSAWAEFPIHDPFKTSQEMNLVREQCTGLWWSSWGAEPCEWENISVYSSCTKHCHALDICRSLALGLVVTVMERSCQYEKQTTERRLQRLV